MLRAQMGLVQRVYLSVYAAAGTTGSGLQALPTVTVASARSGTNIVTAAATTAAGSGLYYYDLLPSNSTSQLDDLTLTWSYTYESAAQTQTDLVRVVGQRLTSLEAVDASLGRGGAAANYTHRQKDLAVQAAEEALEAEIIKAFAPRYGTASVDGNSRSDWITLPDYPVQSLLTIAVDGTSKTVGNFTLYPETGRVKSTNSEWTTGDRNVTVTYTHGWTSVPMDVSRAVTLIASSLLADGPWDDRGYGVTTDGGFVRLLTAGVGATAFSIPEVQAVVNRHRRPLAEQILAGQ